MGEQRARIPNDDVPGWLKALREGGLSDAEIDRVLGGLNEEYERAKRAAPPPAERVNDESSPPTHSSPEIPQKGKR
jgi:hypothetical protein